MLRFFAITIMVCSFTCISSAQVKTEGQVDDVSFEMVFEPNITIGENRKITEITSYIASDGVKLERKTIYFRKAAEAQQAVLDRVKLLERCSAIEKVSDAEGEELGIRSECQESSEGKGREFITIFSYSSTTVEYRCLSKEHLLAFEKTSCPRSSNLAGQECPEIYLKKNWVKTPPGEN